MAGRYTADVIFFIDASDLMLPCFDSVRRHVSTFVDGLRSDGQANRDLRVELLAYRAGHRRQGGTVLEFESLRHMNLDLIQRIYGSSEQWGEFFTSNIEEFKYRLGLVEVRGDEATFVALDVALDFPWREAAGCHRVVVPLTDEALETGVMVSGQVRAIPNLIEKLHALRVKLFLIGPKSSAFDALSAADRSEYQIVDGEQSGLANVDFAKVLAAIGESVSVSTLQGISSTKAPRGIFEQTGRSSCVDTAVGR